MCLGTIAKVIEVHPGRRALVEDHGQRQLVLEMTVSDGDITPGDWVVVQSGFALELLTQARRRACARATS